MNHRHTRTCQTGHSEQHQMYNANAPAARQRPGAGHEGVISVPKSKTTADPYKRHSTRHRGVTYRERADGSRTYSVYSQGGYVARAGSASPPTSSGSEPTRSASTLARCTP